MAKLTIIDKDKLRDLRAQDNSTRVQKHNKANSERNTGIVASYILNDMLCGGEERLVAQKDIIPDE